MLKRLKIKNFKCFESFDLSLADDLNIIVGDNEKGKSTILEAIALASTRRINGKLIESELSSHLFNKEVTKAFLSELSAGKTPALPSILIELFFKDASELAALRGTNNSEKADEIGVKLEILFNDDYAEEYATLLKDKQSIKAIPSEYYKVQWLSFANNALTVRTFPIGVSNIDATAIRLQSGTDYFLQEIINGSLDAKEKISLSIAYRSLKETFSGQAGIQTINTKLTHNQVAITDKKLAITLDTSQKAGWESALVPHLDDLPFPLIGKGEQSALKIMLALERKGHESNIILVEEPENHLSFSSMTVLISKMREKCDGKQIIIVTHSAYVLNKLGLDKVVLLGRKSPGYLTKLPGDTLEYFKKLSGYDTLRLILAKKCILVEGPSDELIIQKAYHAKYGKMPLDDGTDVINVRGLSFARFLDIAKELKIEAVVVTDNDGNFEKNVRAKYSAYNGIESIKICADSNDSLKTLEPQFVDVNSIESLNAILNRQFTTKAEVVGYMESNKTEWALAIFEAKQPVVFPKYIQDAIQ